MRVEIDEKKVGQDKIELEGKLEVVKYIFLPFKFICFLEGRTLEGINARRTSAEKCFAKNATTRAKVLFNYY